MDVFYHYTALTLLCLSLTYVSIYLYKLRRFYKRPKADFIDIIKISICSLIAGLCIGICLDYVILTNEELVIKVFGTLE